jgi:hypothetical protein
MRRLNLDESWQVSQGLAVVGVRPRPGFGEDTGQQAKTSDGIPRWIVTAVTESGENLAVTVPAVAMPQLERFSPVIFVDLVAGGSNSGLWFAASAVQEAF